MASLTCTDCGADHEARADAKVCAPCRLLRNLMYCSTKWKRAKKCRACAARFRPLHVRDLSFCAACEVKPAHAKPRPEIECRVCKRNGPAAHKGVPVCLACAKDPGAPPPKPARLEESELLQERYARELERPRGQGMVIAALLRGQEARRANRDSALARA